ncbi:MAG: hypothetical protein GX620_16665 [Chloroflexi bacterium]|nr:hypothetical protein [Chloroflexota bacterium]
MNTMSVTHPTKFIVLCHARTGSGLLGSLLSNHHSIHWANEEFKYFRQWHGPRRLLRPIIWRYPRTYLNYLAHHSERPVFGCKIAPYYMLDIGSTVVDLHRHGWLIVALRRRNSLQEAISLLVARHTGQYGRPAPQTAAAVTPTVEIALMELLAQIRSCIRLAEREQQAVAHVPHLPMVYERELQNPARWHDAAGRVFDALGLERVPY